MEILVAAIHCVTSLRRAGAGSSALRPVLQQQEAPPGTTICTFQVCAALFNPQTSFQVLFLLNLAVAPKPKLFTPNLHSLFLIFTVRLHFLALIKIFN